MIRANFRRKKQRRAQSQVQLLEVLTACRAIVCSCDLSSGQCVHTIPPQLWRACPSQQPISLRAALRIVHRQDRHEAIARARCALQERIPYVQHLRLLLDGSEAPIWMEWHASLISDDKGRPILLQGVLIDVSAHRKLQQALEEADHRKDEFMATLAHELRNPLTAIAAVSQLLSVRTVDASELKTCVDIIRRQTRQLARLAEDLIDLTRVVRDELIFKREPVYLQDCIKAAIEATQEALKEHRHTLQVVLPDSRLQIDADPVRLGQLFGNLLSNAIKYTPGGGSIWVSLQFERGWARVSVRDSGIGISAEHLPHIFEPFYRADTVLRRNKGGLGIGLALCHRIALMHGGSISVDTAGPGRGCEFVVRLPLLAAGVVAAHSDTERAGKRSPGLRVLIAEDDVDVANALALSLRMSGLEVSVVLDGKEALEAAERIHPQVALLDIDMPKCTGQEVAAQIRTRSWAMQQAICLIGLTGWNSRELHELDLGVFDAMVLKPPQIEEIERLIRAHANSGANSTRPWHPATANGSSHEGG